MEKYLLFIDFWNLTKIFLRLITKTKQKMLPNNDYDKQK